MKFSNYLTVLFLLATFTLSAQSKNKPGLNLSSAVVVGQMDNSADRYSIEVTLTQLLTEYGITAVPALNIVKTGQDAAELAEDSLATVIKEKNIDTYILVSVRGYDKKFKSSVQQDSLSMALSNGNLYEIYQMDIVSVSFEFKFYRNGAFVYSDIVKIGSVGDREGVLKKFRRKVSKRIRKAWKN